MHGKRVSARGFHVNISYARFRFPSADDFYLKFYTSKRQQQKKKKTRYNFSHDLKFISAKLKKKFNLISVHTHAHMYILALGIWCRSEVNRRIRILADQLDNV